MQPTIYTPSDLSQSELPALSPFLVPSASHRNAFMEHGHERGAGPSLLPDRARIQVSVPLELDEWLAETAVEAGLPLATLVRRILSAARRRAAA